MGNSVCIFLCIGIVYSLAPRLLDAGPAKFRQLSLGKKKVSVMRRRKFSLGTKTTMVWIKNTRKEQVFPG